MTQLFVVSGSVADAVAPTLGASGGVFGLLLAFRMVVPKNAGDANFSADSHAGMGFVTLYGVVELASGCSARRAGSRISHTWAVWWARSWCSSSGAGATTQVNGERIGCTRNICKVRALNTERIGSHPSERYVTCECIISFRSLRPRWFSRSAHARACTRAMRARRREGRKPDNRRRPGAAAAAAVAVRARHRIARPRTQPSPAIRVVLQAILPRQHLTPTRHDEIKIRSAECRPRVFHPGPAT